MKKDKIFENLCKKYFKFLEDDFDYKFSAKYDIFGDYVIYQNLTTAVEINFVPRDAGMVYIWLTRLVDGEIVPDPVEIKPKAILNTFDLEDLLTLRAPSFKVERPPIEKLMKPFTARIFKKTIAQLAETLKLYAQDILKGDFKIFTELEKVVKRRAEKHRIITVTE